MSAELPGLLLSAVARGQGSAEMLLELLAVLHDKGVLTEADVQRVVAVMAAEMRDFDREVRASAHPSQAGSLKG